MRRLAMISGLLTIAACAWFAFVWCAAPYMSEVAALDPAVLLASLTIALPLSVFSGVYWKRWMFGFSVLILATLVLIGLRWH